MANDKSIVVLFVLSLFLIVSRVRVECWQTISEEDDLEFERRLNILNKPPVKTFQLKDGDLFDCIDIYKQPAFDHPLLKDHNLQLRPSSIPKSMRNDQSVYSDHAYNRTCPLGTVLIRRTKKEDLINSKHLLKSLRRYHTEESKASNEEGSIMTVLRTDAGEYYGAHAKMTVYGLPNLAGNQSSINQILVVGGANGPIEKVNTVQAGWHVTPFTYHSNSKTHFFTYWTADGYKSTGCVNQHCPGFVMTGGTIGPGSEITDLSVYGGTQRSLEITIFKDAKTGNWWLTHGNGNPVGYWPKELFNNLDSATEIDWGGSTFSEPNELNPPLCSGHFPSEGPNKTCYFTQVALVDIDNKLYKPSNVAVSLTADKPDYYGITGNFDSGDEDGYMFRYGGPGASK